MPSPSGVESVTEQDLYTENLRGKRLENQKSRMLLPYVKRGVLSELEYRESLTKNNQLDAIYDEATMQYGIKLKELEAVEKIQALEENVKNKPYRDAVNKLEGLKANEAIKLSEENPELFSYLTRIDDEYKAAQTETLEYKQRQDAKYDWLSEVINVVETNPNKAGQYLQAISNKSDYRKYNFKIPEYLQNGVDENTLINLKKERSMILEGRAYVQELEKTRVKAGIGAAKQKSLSDYNRSENAALEERTLGTNEFFLPNGQKVTLTELRQEYKAAYNIMDEDELAVLAYTNKEGWAKEKSKKEKAPSFEEWARKERHIDVTGRTNLGKTPPAGNGQTPSIDTLPIPEKNRGMKLLDHSTGDTLQTREVDGDWVWWNTTKNKRHTE